MGYREYIASISLEGQAHYEGGNPFYSLLMAAMRAADTDNLAKLESVFPDVLSDLRARYNAPGGYLPGEKALE